MPKKRETKNSLAAQKRRLSQYKRLLRSIKTDRTRLDGLVALMRRSKETGLAALWGMNDEMVEDYRRYIENNVAQSLTLAAELQQYIRTIKDREIRHLFILHYIYGYSWQKVAFMMGWFDESVPRKRHDRYLTEHPAFAMPAAPGAEECLDDIDGALRREVCGNGR